MSKDKFWIMICGFVLFLAGCQSAGRPELSRPATGSPSFQEQAYRNIPADEGKVFWIDSQASEVFFYIWRGGPLAEKGHNHVMVVRKMEGAVFIPRNLTEDPARFDIVFKAADIQVDPLDLRKQIGGAFESGMTEEGAQGTREHMLGEKVLDARNFATVGLSSQKTYGEPPKMVFDTRITLHGFERRYLIPVTIRLQNGRLHARGSFVIKQSDFGIEPYSALGGALYILDPIMLEFSMVAETR